MRIDRTTAVTSPLPPVAAAAAFGLEGGGISDVLADAFAGILLGGGIKWAIKRHHTKEGIRNDGVLDMIHKHMIHYL